MLKRISSLVAVMFTGFLLVASPGTAVQDQSSIEARASDVVQIVTTGEPPDSDGVTGDTTTASGDTTTGSGDTTATSAETTTSTIGVVTGAAVNTRFGYFQVEVTVEEGVLTAVDVLQQPTDGHSRRINSRALPAYEQAALAAQNADFDHISGATVTWGAYTESLQSALDEAGL